MRKVFIGLTLLTAIGAEPCLGTKTPKPQSGVATPKERAGTDCWPATAITAQDLPPPPYEERAEQREESNRRQDESRQQASRPDHSPI